MFIVSKPASASAGAPTSGPLGPSDRQSSLSLDTPSADQSGTISEPILVSEGNFPDVIDVVLEHKQENVKEASKVCLPQGWIETLPEEDHLWVSEAFFSRESETVSFDFTKVDRLWYSPPQPALPKDNSKWVPKIASYFGHRLMLWMPLKLWRCELKCPHCKKSLRACGSYRHNVKRVVDVDGYYFMAGEYLECSSCRRKVVSWAKEIVDQLDPGHRNQFPCIVTYKMACDLKVARLLRERTAGNGPQQLEKRLAEQFFEAWLRKSAAYLTDCKALVGRGLVTRTFPQMPIQPDPPKYKWLQGVYVRDVLDRLPEIKASQTSVFGTILKMDSTKKIVKKLAGKASGTAQWDTNVGNELGQVLQSVLTVSEGAALTKMIQGIVDRYKNANVPPPKVLYVDRDCCGEHSHLRIQFKDWPDLIIRLDIWHFMRRIARGVVTEQHPLYAEFMSRLSACIFVRVDEDVELLKEAKRAVMLSSGIPNPSGDDVVRAITRAELQLHCRRRTRSADDIENNISSLIETFSGDEGNNTLGVCLLDKEKIDAIWEEQKAHIPCLLDPEGIQLYTKVGTLTKGGLVLPKYRCARGTVSLESFHLHINRFIPGSTSSDMNFQAYLLDGLYRWNENRARQGTTEVTKGHYHSYSLTLRHAVNDLGREVLGVELDTSLGRPLTHSGELIGVEYLYDQTGNTLEPPTEDEGEEEQSEVAEENSFDDVDEGFEEIEDQTIHGLASSVTRRTTDATRTDTTNDDVTPQPSTSGLPETRSLASQESEPATPAPTPVDPPVVESSEEEVRDSRNIPGYVAVANLAEYLKSLRDPGGLSDGQAANVIMLWNMLSDYDKKPTEFPPRHQEALKSRFKASSKRKQTPGVESSRRAFLGANSGPATKPDANRIMESLIERLVDLEIDPVRVGGKLDKNWPARVLKQYGNIRSKVMLSRRVKDETSLQLAEINRHTLTAWHNKKSKRMEQDVLVQGCQLQRPAFSSKEPVPEPKDKPAARTKFVPHPMQFPMQPNTSGQAKMGFMNQSKPSDPRDSLRDVNLEEEITHINTEVAEQSHRELLNDVYFISKYSPEAHVHTIRKDSILIKSWVRSLIDERNFHTNNDNVKLAAARPGPQTETINGLSLIHI